jgi:hypothetical protein
VTTLLPPRWRRLGPGSPFKAMLFPDLCAKDVFSSSRGDEESANFARKFSNAIGFEKQG